MPLRYSFNFFIIIFISLVSSLFPLFNTFNWEQSFISTSVIESSFTKQSLRKGGLYLFILIL